MLLLELELNDSELAKTNASYLLGDGLLASPPTDELPDGRLGGVGAPPELGHVAAGVLALQRLPQRPHHLPRRLQVRLGEHLPRLGLLVRVEQGRDGADNPSAAAVLLLLLPRPRAARRRDRGAREEGERVRSPAQQPRSACTVGREVSAEEAPWRTTARQGQRGIEVAISYG